MKITVIIERRDGKRYAVAIDNVEPLPELITKKDVNGDSVRAAFSGNARPDGFGFPLYVELGREPLEWPLVAKP